MSNHGLAFDNAFEAVLDAISDGVYVTDDQRRIVYWNKSAELITGYAADEVLGSHCHDNVLVHQDLDGRQLCVAICPLARTIETGEPNTFSEVMLKRKDGRRLSVYVKTARLQAGGRSYGVEIFGELDALAGRDLVERIQQLSDASVTDVLTGQFNRRYVDVALAQHFSLYQRLGQRFGVTIIDLDNLKQVNDEFGHAAGDAAIRFVAGILADNARKMDIVDSLRRRRVRGDQRLPQRGRPARAGRAHGGPGARLTADPAAAGLRRGAHRVGGRHAGAGDRHR